MKISAFNYNTNTLNINNQKYQQNKQTNKSSLKSETNVLTLKNNKNTSIPTFKGLSSDPNYGLATLHVWQMNKLKEETKKFPQDIKYREQLMINAGLNPKNQHKLRAIIGPQEIKSVMKSFDNKPEVFSIGENWSNVHNTTMRANLHMHTTASDGSLSVQELLDKAVEYAEQVKKENPKSTEPFVIAITDHDTTEGVQEAIKAISEKPLKYQNLRVILGVEMTTFNNIAPESTKVPTNTHVLVYGIDPNEKGFKSFIEETKAKKLQIQNMMVSKANNVYEKHFNKKNFYEVVEAKHQYNTVDKNIIGIFNGMEAYFDTKVAVEEVVFKDRKLKKSLEKHNVSTTTEQFMEKLSEFNNSLNGNNKVRGPKESLPEFIAVSTGLDPKEVSQRLEKGLKSPKLIKFQNDLKTDISEYKVSLNPKYDYMPTFETLYKGLSGQKNAMAGIAHPVDTLKYAKNTDDKYSFLEDLYTKFKTEMKEKAKFTEAYYQSYKPQRKEFNDNPKTQKFFERIGKVFKLFRTGSADTHGMNIFVR